MNEHIRKGSKGQLIGLNLWVVCLFLGFMAFTMFKESPIGFLLVFLILVIFIIGFVRMYAGSYPLLRGSFIRRGRWMVLISIILTLSAPLLFFLGIFSGKPLNYIFIQLSLWAYLSSFVFPYMRRGGIITGALALLVSAAIGIFILGYVMYASTTLPWIIPASLALSYFILLELTMFRCYLRSLTNKDIEHLPELELKSDALAIRTTSVPGPVRMKMRPKSKRTDPKSEVSTKTRPSNVREEVDPRMTKRDVRSFEDFVKEMDPPSNRRPSNEPFIPQTIRMKVDPIPIPEPDPDIDLEMDGVLMDGEDLYTILRVDRGASVLAIRKAYRTRALLYHPDRNRDGGELYRESINEEMRKLNKAKEILFNSEKRNEYDIRLNFSEI